MRIGGKKVWCELEERTKVVSCEFGKKVWCELGESCHLWANVVLVICDVSLPNDTNLNNFHSEHFSVWCLVRVTVSLSTFAALQSGSIWRMNLKEQYFGLYIGKAFIVTTVVAFCCADYSAVRQLVKQKPYCGVMIGLQLLPVTCSIQVLGIRKLTSEQLSLYFENVSGGVDVADVNLYAEDGCAVVRFEDSSGKNVSWIFICYLEPLGLPVNDNDCLNTRAAISLLLLKCT